MSPKPSRNQNGESAVQTPVQKSPKIQKRTKSPEAGQSELGSKIGYARVSTDDQHLNRQLDALGAVGCQLIYQESISGKSLARPELENCLKALRPGDTLVVWRLDRLGRSFGDLVATITGLDKQGIGFESFSEK